MQAAVRNRLQGLKIKLQNAQAKLQDVNQVRGAGRGCTTLGLLPRARLGMNMCTGT
jgi:hypothetical protein